MKKKYLILLCFSPFLMGQAQTTMNVKEKSGTDTPFALTGVKTLTFAGGNMSVNKADGSASAYALTDIRYLNFSAGITTSLMGESSINNVVNCYPNPVMDELHFNFGATTDKPIQVEIIGLDGKEQMSQSFSAQTSHKTINVAALKQGIYFCRINNGYNVSITKFIKN